MSKTKVTSLNHLNLPRHVAIIPDGNRRWAKKNNLASWKGHQYGAERFKEVALAALESGIPYLTFWAASEDNLIKRTKTEVRFLIFLMKKILRQELDKNTFIKKKTKVRLVGKWKELLKDDDLKNLISRLEKSTEKFANKNLTILFGYDGRREMLSAIKRGGINFEKYLWTKDLPPVDLVIRTGGEPHWSAGFMMWHTADSQLYFTKTLWPDFGKKRFYEALLDFSKRGRRFGG